MRTLALAATGLTLALSGCAKPRTDALAFAADVDASRGTAVFTCRESTSGRCILRFDDPGVQPQSLTIAKGEVAAVTGIATGSSYCATTGAPRAVCKPQTLQAGSQAIRFEKHLAL